VCVFTAFKIAARILSTRFPLFEDGHDYTAAESAATKKLQTFAAHASFAASSSSTTSTADSPSPDHVLTSDTQFWSLKSSNERLNYMEYVFFRAMSRHCLQRLSQALTDYDALVKAIQWIEKKQAVPQFYYAYLLRARCSLSLSVSSSAASAAASTASAAASAASAGGSVWSRKAYVSSARSDLRHFLDRIRAVDDTEAEHARSGGNEQALRDRGMIGSRMVNPCDYAQAAYVLEALGDWSGAEQQWTICVEWEHALPDAAREQYRLCRARAATELMTSAQAPTGAGAARLIAQIFRDCKAMDDSKEALLLLAYAHYLSSKPRDAKRALDTLHKRLGPEMNDEERKEAKRLRSMSRRTRYCARSCLFSLVHSLAL
jgi:hypothetical protein